MSAPTKTIVDSLRELVQDLLVPELRAVRISVDSVRTEMQLRDEKLQESIDSVRAEMRLRDEGLRKEIQLRDERTQELIHDLGKRLDTSFDIRERLAALEARLPRQ